MSTLHSLRSLWAQIDRSSRPCLGKGFARSYGFVQDLTTKRIRPMTGAEHRQLKKADKR